MSLCLEIDSESHPFTDDDHCAQRSEKRLFKGDCVMMVLASGSFSPDETNLSSD